MTARALKPADNPRLVLPRHRERGPEVLIRVTYLEIARLVGLAVGSVKNAAGRGELDPRDLGSVVAWIAKRRQKASRSKSTGVTKKDVAS